MRYSVRSIIGWTVVIAILIAMMKDYCPFAIFILSLVFPVVIACHVRLPHPTIGRVFYMVCFLIAFTPFYFALMGPLYFFYGLVGRSSKLAFLESIDNVFFAPVHWVFRILPFDYWLIFVKDYLGAWMVYGGWFKDVFLDRFGI